MIQTYFSFIQRIKKQRRKKNIQRKKKRELGFGAFLLNVLKSHVITAKLTLKDIEITGRKVFLKKKIYNKVKKINLE